MRRTAKAYQAMHGRSERCGMMAVRIGADSQAAPASYRQPLRQCKSAGASL